MEDVVRVGTEPLDVAAALLEVQDPGAGASAVFVGTTRNHFDGRPVRTLLYEAYEPMAVAELRRVAAEARARWSVHRLVLLHRLGEVPVGVASVVVVASSAHRREALDAVAFCIDRLKATVPIWKKEVYADDGAVWKANAEALTAANAAPP